jgi:hypothetical protein
MLRSIRISILASIVALAFVACGGGNSNPPVGDGGTGQEDGNHIQFDAQHDGLPPQQDGGGGGDGGGGACVASGGGAQGDICKASKPCTCPLDCANPGGSPYAGACFPIYNGTACDNSGDAPVQFTGETTAHCYPVAPITGSFSVPIAATSAGSGGTASATITLNGVTGNFGEGWVYHDTTNAEWNVILYPAGITGYPYQVLIVVIPDAEYLTTTPVNFDTGSGFILFYEYQTSAHIGLGQSNVGTLTLTAAPTTVGGTVTGSFGAGTTLFGTKEEICGPNSTPCTGG